jgi:hypothetical protein
MNILERARHLVCDMNPAEAERLALRHRPMPEWPAWAQSDYKLACDAMVAVRMDVLLPQREGFKNPDGSIPLPQFRFIEFNATRAGRRPGAARVEIIPSLLHEENDPPYWVWMSRRDIERNLKNWGRHPELLKALAAFGSPANREGKA